MTNDVWQRRPRFLLSWLHARSTEHFVVFEGRSVGSLRDGSQGPRDASIGQTDGRYNGVPINHLERFKTRGWPDPWADLTPGDALPWGAQRWPARILSRSNTPTPESRVSRGDDIPTLIA